VNLTNLSLIGQRVDDEDVAGLTNLTSLRVERAVGLTKECMEKLTLLKEVNFQDNDTS
jgi:hypothetical protein